MKVRCKACGYSFDTEKHDRCPKCGTRWQVDYCGGGTMALWGDKHDAIAGVTPQGPVAVRIYLQEYGGGLKWDLNKEVFKIGRAADSDLLFSDMKISRMHAEIISNSSGCYLVDVGSTNSTYLNGARLQPNQMYYLNPNDVISFYKIQFVFVVEGMR